MHRDKVLGFLGEPPLLDPDQTERYATDSQPVIEDGPDILRLEQLLDLLTEGQRRIEARLATFDRAAFEHDIPFDDRTRRLGFLLFFFYFHDTYHTGQTDWLRQLAGKQDQVL